MDPAELWQEAWDMMVTGLDEEDADMLVGDASPADSFFDAEFAESILPVDDTSATGRPSSRAINTEILKERALQLPQLLLKARQSDDLQMMQSLIEENFSPDCTFQSDSMDEPVIGRKHLLRLVSATMDVFPDSISTFKRSYVNKREEIVFEVSVVGTNAVDPYSTAAPVTSVGAPSIIGVSMTGKVVSLNFNPNGSSLLGYDVIGIPSSFTAGDTLFLTSTPSAVEAYSSSASQSFYMSFDFSTLVQAAGFKYCLHLHLHQ